MMASLSSKGGVLKKCESVLTMKKRRGIKMFGMHARGQYSCHATNNQRNPRHKPQRKATPGSLGMTSSTECKRS